MLSTFILFGPYRYNIDQYNAVLSNPQPIPLSVRISTANQYSVIAQDIRTADFILLGALSALAVTGIIEAQVNFVPERNFTRPRKLPAMLVPTFSPLQNGGEIGVFGRF